MIWFTQLAGGFNPQLTAAVKDIEVYLKGVASHINIKVFIKLFESMMSYDGRLRH